MEQYAGIDVSLESASICVVDAGGRILREAKVASEPEALIAWFGTLEVTMTRIAWRQALALWLPRNELCSRCYSCCPALGNWRQRDTSSNCAGAVLTA
jgi:hypothetical protein